MKRVLSGILIVGLSVHAWGAWTLIEDFDSYDNTSATLVADGITGGVWAEVPVGDGSAHIVDDNGTGDQSIAVYGSGWRGIETDLQNSYASDFSLADGNTATYFFQFMTEGDDIDCMFGLTESTNSVDESNAWQDYAVMPYVAGGQFKVYGENIGDSAVGFISTGQWYNVWLVVDNGTKEFDVYWSEGSTNAVLAESDVQFGRITAPGDLAAFAFSQNLSSMMHVDNLYKAVGVDTSFPSLDILDVPEPERVGGALAGVTNETVYLMCYHEGYYPDGGNSGVFLSWSTNGYDFKVLNNGHPVFVPPEFPGDDNDNTDGYENLVRDPSIVYGPDGLFHLVYTSDINSRSFGYAESPDLVNWSNVKLVQIWQNEPETIGHTWAPEIFYDDVEDEYQIAFSSNIGTNTLRLYYTVTSDFDSWTDPEELYYYPEGSWEQIDACVAKVDTGSYAMVYKESAEIWIMDSTTPHGPWTNAVQVSAGGDEGPCIIRIGDAWHVYYDNYGYGDDVFGLAVSTDLINWTDATSSADMPKKADVPDYGYDGGPPHHSTVFAAPLSALGAFTEPYQDNVTNLSTLVYRWSFDEDAASILSGSTVTDSVSGAVGTVLGAGAEFSGSGLQLPGGTTGTGDAAYFDMPNGIVSALTNLTVEIWATPLSSQSWQRLFSFGRTADAGTGEYPGPASSATSASNAVYWTLNVGTDLSVQQCAMRNYADDDKDAVSGTCLDTFPGEQYHYVFTFEDGIGFFAPDGGRMSFYRDGVRIGWRDVSFRLQDLDDVNNWLGRSQWSADYNSNVEYNEVRIYSDVLSWGDIYGHFLAGPDVAVDEHPALQLGLEGTTLTLRWPGNAVGSLQRAGELSASTEWTAVTNRIGNSTNGLHVTLPVVGDQTFYRLNQ